MSEEQIYPLARAHDLVDANDDAGLYVPADCHMSAGLTRTGLCIRRIHALITHDDARASAHAYAYVSPQICCPLR